MQQDRVAELSGRHEQPTKDEAGGTRVATLHPIHVHKTEDCRLQHNRRGDTPRAWGRPGHYGAVLRTRTTPALPERTALGIKRTQRKLKDNTAHQELFAKRRAEHRGQDGKRTGIAHARFLDKLAVVGRGIGQQRQHGVGHVANDHLQGKTDHDNAGDAFPRPTRSPAERMLALRTRHKRARPQITPPQQRHQKRRRLSGGLKQLNVEVIDRKTHEHRCDAKGGEQNDAQGNIDSDDAKTGKRPRYRIEHASLLKTRYLGTFLNCRQKMNVPKYRQFGTVIVDENRVQCQRPRWAKCRTGRCRSD